MARVKKVKRDPIYNASDRFNFKPPIIHKKVGDWDAAVSKPRWWRWLVYYRERYEGGYIDCHLVLNSPIKCRPREMVDWVNAEVAKVKATSPVCPDFEMYAVLKMNPDK